MGKKTDTKHCASCGAPRGNVRRRWDFVNRDGREVSATCPECPRAEEPIRRLEGSRGVRFRAVVDATPPGAAKRVQRTRTCPTLEDARGFVEEVRTAVAREGGYAPPEQETVRELAERWLNTRRDVREVSHLGYKTALRSALAYLGDRPVTSVRVGDVEEYIAWALHEGAIPKKGEETGRGLAPRTVRYCLTGLAQAFDLAVREETVSRNVVRLAKLPRQGTKGRDLPHWDRATLLRFAAAADEDDLAAVWRLALCGLTRSEVHGLRWQDVDLANGLVTVKQGRVALQAGETVVGELKSPQRRRTIPVEQIWPGTVALLRVLRARQAEDRLTAGAAWKGSGADLVMVDELGQGTHPERFSTAFRALVRAEGLPAIRLHALRHSLALELIRIGVPPTDGAALLGHRVEVFMGIYLPEGGVTGVKNAAARLAESFAQARSAS